MLSKLFKLSQAFYRTAKIKEDMAIRIIHSLIPMFTSDRTLAREKSMMLAPEIIKGANYLMQHSLKIIGEELYFSHNGYVDRQTYSFKLSNPKDALLYASKTFGTKETWNHGYGGEKWKDFSDKLYELYNLLELFENNPIYSLLQKIIILMNVIDQMEHNSAAFYKNIFNIENEKRNDYIRPE